MESPVSRARNPKARTACDRCYQLKERCERATRSSAECARCERLRLACSTVRPVRLPGRRVLRGHDSNVASKAASGRLRKPGQTQPGIGAHLDSVPNLQPQERELLVFLLSQPESLDDYVVCSSFRADQQNLLASQLPDASPFLKDAYLACALAVKQLQSGAGTDVDSSVCVIYISKAISALRSLPILRPQDTVLCHALGGVLAFSIYSVIGVGVPDVCRFSLGTTESFAGTTASGSGQDPWQSFLVLLDTMNSLVYRRKPTRRIQMADLVVDCRLGLCLPLLEYYHDLCVISNSLQHTTDIGILARLQKQLDGIHGAVASWQPSHADKLIDQFDSTEIVNLLAQAKVYRLGALLVAHRLQHPFGSDDVQAEIWSKEVMMELELAKRVTKQPLRFVTLPFMVAAVEIRDDSARLEALQRVDDYVASYAPALRTATKTFLMRVWQERDTSLACRWFDSIHKPCPVVDSIDATCFG
ncbi:hypothetical protein GE09DRAFT_291718 [Coniochaeta sp. 2T2.1]|nr:hypothetical protein GE09DRAFT_291718 [Coniochaeta sp. 2T2.1]